MKKSELKQIIKEEIKTIMNESSESSRIFSKELGGPDDREFLKIVWKLSIPELEELLAEAKTDIIWAKNLGAKGAIMGTFNRRNINLIKIRIKYLNEIISYKKKNPEFIPDQYK
jgi:hypothetical protein